MIDAAGADDDASRPDPSDAGTPAEFIDAMQRLKAWSGLGYRELEKRAAAAGEVLPRSTVTAALARDALPREELLAGFVRACGCGEQVGHWIAARRRIAARPGTTEVDDAPVPPPGGAPPAGRHTAALSADHDPHMPAVQPVGGGSRRPGSPVPSTELGPRRRGRIFAVVFAVTVTVAAAGWWGVDRSASGRPSAGLSASPLDPPVYRRASVADLTDFNDIDLDTGTVGAQKSDGMDFSVWGRANHLTARTIALVALLPGTGPETFQRCASTPARDRILQIHGLHDLPAGRNICVWTTDGRVAMLTLDRAPDAAGGALSFHYVVWQFGSAGPGRGPRAMAMGLSLRVNPSRHVALPGKISLRLPGQGHAFNVGAGRRSPAVGIPPVAVLRERHG